MINQEIIDGVVQHMNEDHADACLAIARALGKSPDAQTASMSGMDSVGIDLLVLLNNGEKKSVRVSFAKPVSRENQIRGHIVALTKTARSILEQ